MKKYTLIVAFLLAGCNSSTRSIQSYELNKAISICGTHDNIHSYTGYTFQTKDGAIGSVTCNDGSSFQIRT